MGKLQEFDITFSNNKVVYGPGESISGTVKIRTGNSLQYKGKILFPPPQHADLHAFLPRLFTRGEAQESAQLDGYKLFFREESKSEADCGLWKRHVCTLQPGGGRFSGTSCFSQPFTSTYCFASINASWLLWVKDGKSRKAKFFLTPFIDFYLKKKKEVR